jgi:ACS family hexuronate transporter-like MFS transporter
MHFSAHQQKIVWELNMPTRWFVIFMLFIAGAINYIDRAALSLIAPLISKDLELSPSQLGIVFSAFFVGYSLFCFIGGYFSDRIGPKRVFIIAVTVWSAFCALTGTVFSFASLLIVRVIFGFGEGPFASTGSKMVNNWFGVTERGRAVGIVNAGNPIGGAIAGPLVGLLALTIGWRWTFLVVGLLGILWVTVWAVTVSDKPDTEATTPTAKADAALAVPQSIAFYIRQPIILFTAFAFFGWNYILYFFLSWFPTYLTAAKGLSMQNMSIVTIIPWLVGFVGLASGGFFVDWVVIRSGNALQARKMILVAGLLAAAICVGIGGLVESAMGAVTLMALAVFCLYLTAPAYWTIIQDVVPSPKVGGVTGFVHLLANTSGIVGPSIAGYIVQYGGGFTGAFLLAGAIGVVSSVAVGVFGQAPKLGPARLTA